ncbi:10326_t:CDS:2, partial [Diversispora eburnea]
LVNEYEVSERIISDILKVKDHWLVIDLNSYQASLRRKKKILFSIIEEVLTLWTEEAFSAPLQNLDEMYNNINQILKNYDLQDIFNCDEIDLFWKMKPNRTISNQPILGTKQSKNRVTVLLTCNITGTEKLKLLFIHKYKNSRALKHINKKTLPVYYYWNLK